MEKITKEERRNRCLPSFGSIYRSKRTGKKEAAAAKTKVEADLIIVKNEDKSNEEQKKIEKCWMMSEDGEGGKSTVEYDGSSILNTSGVLRGDEDISEEEPEEVAEILIDKEEDSEFLITMVLDLLVEDNKSLQHKSNAANKNSSLLDEEVITGEGSKECDGVLSIDESLKVVETEKVDKADEKSTVEQRLENVDANRTQAEQPTTQEQAITIQKQNRAVTRPRQPTYVPSPSARGQGYHVSAAPINMGICAPPSHPMRNDFNKVKTFDLKGVIKSSGKGLKSIAWPRRFSVK
ncbi:hypothetical protein AT5G60350 [Arabidopsis thaliana]|uniref:Uncharacterized protein n=1 Tax=Arabidopsis thaliana TaxID=3702 RepID=A0A1P8BG42_ARATH|nr:uncharacterized protein AT5G60350 [Arabidopsis thaliana]ANM70536.1 hypothetical protein AT5G60350 [Arabidopsis thaliana]|eukprot:NP_001332138.1 hypothetical protein AT5G60350 [Arabidopsis thaliana]